MRFALAQAGLMLTNGVAVLNNDRFLERSERMCLTTSAARSVRHGTGRRPASSLCAPCRADGWGFSQMREVNSFKMSIIGGIHAVQYFRSERHVAGRRAAVASP